MLKATVLSTLLFASSAHAAAFPAQAACRCLKDRGSSKVTVEVRANKKGKAMSVWVDPEQSPEVAACLQTVMSAVKWEPWAQVRHTLVVIDFPSAPRLK